MPPGSYVLRHAAGALAVDYSNASSLALLDPRTRSLVERGRSTPSEIDPAMLPELGAGTQAVGPVTPAFAEATGLDPCTVVAIGCGDEMAATLGAGVFAPGEVCDVVGTAEPVCAASAEPRRGPDDAGRVPPARRPRRWLLENPGFVSGGNLRWWRDQFAPIERDAEAVGLGDAYDLLVDRGRRTSPPGPRAWCSCPACRERWRPSGTAPPAASSTASRWPTPGPT